MRNFRNYFEEARNMVFKPQAELKPAEYEDIEIFEEGWQEIQLPTPPNEENEIDKVILAVQQATDQDKEEYKNCDKDASYYIKEYMDKKGLDYDMKNIEYIEDQCVPIIRHYKNYYNRPRPYQVADKMNKVLNRFNTETATTPSYPSGHTVQPLVVAYHYGKIYPEHRDKLIEGAQICGYGRVIAGLHYPSDFEAGVLLAKRLMEFIDHEKF